MKYALLIYHSETESAKMSPEASQSLMNAYWGFSQALSQAGAHTGGEALHPTSTATSVRVREGNILTV
ncbi:MAG: YciI family protein, partial [Candidatus Promineifilaceae bacterium]